MTDDQATVSWSSDSITIDTVETSTAGSIFRASLVEQVLEKQRTAIRSQELAALDISTPEISSDAIILSQTGSLPREVLAKTLTMSLPELISELGAKNVGEQQDNFRRFLEDLHQANLETVRTARASFASRFIITIVRQDAVGAFADIGRWLRNCSCSIEVANMIVVAGELFASLIVSGPPEIDEHRLRATLVRLARQSGSAVEDGLIVNPATYKDPVWPVEGSTEWSVTALVPDRHGSLAVVTEAISKHKVPLTSFATWVTNDGFCGMEIAYAVQSDVDDEDVARDVRNALESLQAEEFSVRRASGLKNLPSDSFFEPRTSDSVLLMGIGTGAPGLVAAIASGLSEGTKKVPEGFNILFSAMTILDGSTAVVLIVDGDGNDPDVDLAVEARLAARKKLDSQGFVADIKESSRLGAGQMSERPSSKKSHSLRCEIDRLADIAVDVAEAVRQVDGNIIWLLTGSKESWDGETARFATEVHMDLALTQSQADALGERLSELEVRMSLSFELNQVVDLVGI